MSETVKDRANKFYDAYAKSSGGKRVLDLLTEFGEAERKRAIEGCALLVESTGHNNTRQIAASLRALIAPPVPAWTHFRDCPTPYQWSEADKWWTCPMSCGGNHVLRIVAKFCDGCGAPKPEVNK